MIIDKWHNITSLAELTNAVNQLNDWAKTNKIHPDTVYVTQDSAIFPAIFLDKRKLSDGSEIYDIRIV